MTWKDPEARRAYMREYKRQRRQTVQGRAEHSAEEAARYARKGPQIRAAVQAYRQANPQKCREWQAAKRARDPEGFRIRKNAYGHKRRTLGRVDAKAAADTIDSACGLCSYCLREAKLEIDHAVPLSRGGSCDADNLVAACGPCNRRKHARTPLEWVFGFGVR